MTNLVSILLSFNAGHQKCDMMLRTYVSKVAADKGRAILEGIGLPSEIRDVCYINNPLNVEEAIQCGLLKWRNGSGDSPTWAVLLKAMEYAGIAVQHITKLKEEILKGAFSQPLMLYHVSTLCCVQAAVGSPVQSLLGSTLLLLQGTYCKCTPVCACWVVVNVHW